MYATATPVGTLTIRVASDDIMGCELWLNDNFVGSFPSAAAAAHSVSRHCSGCDLIDDARTPLPESIDAWQWISVSSPHSRTDQPMFLVRGISPTL